MEADGGEVLLRTNHQISGNPANYRTGRVALREDDEWRMKMKAPARRIVTIRTWSQLVGYGYHRREK